MFLTCTPIYELHLILVPNTVYGQFTFCPNSIKDHAYSAYITFDRVHCILIQNVCGRLIKLEEEKNVPLLIYEYWKYYCLLVQFWYKWRLWIQNVDIGFLYLLIFQALISELFSPSTEAPTISTSPRIGTSLHTIHVKRSN